MRKALLPMVASLALCGAATVALIATNARADQTTRKPMMIAMANQDTMPGSAAAAPDGAGGPGMMHDMAAHREQMCKNMYARKVGELAYLEAQLSLTPAQEPLFQNWKQASLDIAKQREGDCTTREQRKPGERPGVVDRLNMEETMLKKRLANLQTMRPSLTAFYDSLSPAQKQEFGHDARRHMQGGMHMMMGMMGRQRPPEMGGHMGHGPMGAGPMGSGPMGDAPPPPPPAQ